MKNGPRPRPDSPRSAPTHGVPAPRWARAPGGLDDWALIGEAYGTRVALPRFGSVDVVAAALLAPYLAWVAFAAALNFAVWRLNVAAASTA